jgi:hypothetical protein
MIEISDHAELAARCHGDTLCLWAAQGLDGRSRAWRSPDGTAVAAAGSCLSTRDRIAVHGRASRRWPEGAQWLPETEHPDVAALLKVSFPDSDAPAGCARSRALGGRAR